MSLFYKEGGDVKAVSVIFSIIFAILFLIALNMIVNPIYRVYSAGQTGKAELAQAEYNRQIIVRQAQAKKDAATLEAEAEILRAEGAAKANAVIAGGLGGPEGYLRYLYIQMLSEQSGSQVIYIPTEAGLPILEAGRR